MKPACALFRLVVAAMLAAALAGCLPVGIRGSTQLAGSERPSATAGASATAQRASSSD